MAATAAKAVLLKHIKSKRTIRQEKIKEKIAEKIKEDIVLDSVKYYSNYQQENTRSSREMCKLDANAIWQPRRIIATARRLYILSMREDEKYEIVDLIPMHEIEKVQPIQNFATTVPLSVERQSGNAGGFVRRIRRPPTIRSLAQSSGLFSSNDDLSPISPNGRTLTSCEATLVFAQVPPPGFSKASLENFSQNMDDSASKLALQVHTQKDGYNQGMTYYFRAVDEVSCDEWISTLDQLASQGRAVFQRRYRMKLTQASARSFHGSFSFQTVMILAICANFFSTVAQYQVEHHSCLPPPVNIGNDTVNYVAKASIAKAPDGKGGITLPVHVSGPFTDLKYTFDYGAMVKDAVKQKVDAKVESKKEELKIHNYISPITRRYMITFCILRCYLSKPLFTYPYVIKDKNITFF